MSTPTAIRRVTCYIASPVETCDRCSAGIKNVNAVEFKDGTRQKFGSECINKILAGDTSLRSLFKKNVANLARCQRAIVALSAGEQAPIGHEYYGAGLFFVADSEGESVIGDRGQSFWHPFMDTDKNLAGANYRQDGTRSVLRDGKYVPNTPENWRAMALDGMEAGVGFFQSEVTRIEHFLGRILARAGGPLK